MSEKNVAFRQTLRSDHAYKTAALIVELKILQRITVPEVEAFSSHFFSSILRKAFSTRAGSTRGESQYFYFLFFYTFVLKSGENYKARGGLVFAFLSAENRVPLYLQISSPRVTASDESRKIFPGSSTGFSRRIDRKEYKTFYYVCKLMFGSNF